MLSPIPYDDAQGRDERFFRSKFVLAANAAGLNTVAEPHTLHGRSDAVVFTPEITYVFEFKAATTDAEVAAQLLEGSRQLTEKDYAKPYLDKPQPVRAFTLVADMRTKQIEHWQEVQV